MGAPAQIDYDALAQQHGGQAGSSSSGVDYDGLASAHGGTVSSSSDAVVKKYGLPEGTDLSKGYFDQDSKLKIDPQKFSQAYAEVNPKAPLPASFLGRAWDEAKNIVHGAFSDEGQAPMVGTPMDIIGGAKRGAQAVGQRVEEFKQNPSAASGATAVDIGAAVLPFAIERAPAIWSKVSPAASVEAALSTKLSAVEADTPRPGGQIQPALNNTPREVLQHASDEGIKLTPGQATESGLAQQLQKAGATAAVGGKELANALTEQKTQFGQAVNNFMDKVDPKRAGLSAESAGQTIQDTQGVAKSVSHDNAAQGYQKIEYLMDKPVNPQPISAAWNQLKANLPMGAEDQILAQTPRSMRAVVSDLLSGNPEGFKPTFNQAIQLRKFFRDLGDTDGLPNQMQGIYKQMSGVVDKSMEATATQMNSAQDWRDANAGWKDYATKYGSPQSLLYKIGKQQDPTKIVTMLQNAPATDILTVKQEMGNAALEPLRRQVIQDIAQSRFNIGHDGIGGYSDSYLKALFPPEQVKELYLKGDLANRLKYDPNPSGTGSNLAATSQLTIGNQAKMSAAAKLSMPRDPLSFLPDNAQPSSPGRGSLPEPIPISKPQSQPVAATGTFGSRYSAQQVSAATASEANRLALRDVNSSILKETNPAERLRLQKRRQELMDENQ